MGPRSAALRPPRPPAAATSAALAGLDELRQLAGQLQGLEQAHAQALLKSQQAQAVGASSSAAVDPAAEPLQLLKHRLDLAMEARRDSQAERTGRERDLEEIQRKLAKKRPRLDSLLALQAHEPPPASPSRPSPPHTTAAANPVPGRPHTSAATKEAKARLAALERQLGALDNEFKNVLRPRVEEAKQAVLKQQEAVGALFLSKGVGPILHRETNAERIALCDHFNLPDVYAEVHGSKAPPFELYLDRFTEPTGNGTRQLRPDLLQGGKCSTALSILCEAATCSVGTLEPLSVALVPEASQARLLARLVTGSPAEIAKLLQEAVSRALSRITAIELPDLIRMAANLPTGPATRDEKHRRRTVLEAAQRAETLLPLLNRYREEAQASLVERATRIVAIVADDYRGQSAATATLERQWEARREDMRANLSAAQEMRTQCTAAKAALQAAREADRANRPAAPRATTALPPAGAATVTETMSASAGPDLEARVFKLRGEVDSLSEQLIKAQALLGTAVDADKSADRKERKAQAAYDAAVAAHGRAQDDARRAREEARATRKDQEDEQARLVSRISAARLALTNHPALARVVEPAAVAHAIERHVKPDDAAQHQRAKHETGYAGTYQSLGHLVEAACDVYQDAVRQCPGLFGARSRGEFDAAVAQLNADGQGTVDRVCTHARAVPIARGYSNALDQTERPVAVNESCYSVRWQQGRVLISHLYPRVPHRQLRTLEP